MSSLIMLSFIPLLDFRRAFDRFFLLAGILLLLTVSSQVSAEIYKWRDGRGVIQYSDKRPVDAEYLDVTDHLPHVHTLGINFDDAESAGKPVHSNSRKTRDTKHKKALDNGRLKDARIARLKRQCHKYKEGLDVVQNRLRAGYGAAAGNRLREQRRSLSDKLYRECRGLP